MCFTVINKKQGAKIAEKDIKCWKVVYKNNRAIYQNHFVYKINVVQPTVILIVQYGEIEEGYHSFTNLITAERRCASLSRKYEEEYKVITLIIPKGTKYYENEYDNEYVSSTIKRIRNQKNKEK